MLPAEYASAVDLILPLGLAAVAYAISRVQQGILIAAGRSGRVSTVEVVGMFAAVFFYFALIPAFGASGAAYGSICGYLVTALVGAWYVRRLYK
ncbi:polysaccharide biosynthesis C-terminal domain-containing protein [Microbacterium sp. JZ31]|uniref:polysaccharide biosynthesis C-terminal domain-containing protein n=1 Tax=Microbacterium sp. JZ31 TaxID=1906274 RepID=UPI001933D097|nr:polysaccharide biosynthesis C-terminal domain-containing protein [Microbacterium sp. JZ31]